MTITMKSFFQCSWNIRTFYPSRYACLCAALLLSVCSRFGRLCFMLKFADFLHKPICMSVCRTITVCVPHYYCLCAALLLSVCRTITVCVQPVWPIVLHGRMLLHISVQCRTGTQLLPQLSTWKAQVLFWDFPDCSPASLPVRCWYYSLQEDAYFPSDLKQPRCFSLSTCDIQKVKIAKFIFNRIFYKFYFFFKFLPQT